MQTENPQIRVFHFGPLTLTLTISPPHVQYGISIFSASLHTSMNYGTCDGDFLLKTTVYVFPGGWKFVVTRTVLPGGSSYYTTTEILPNDRPITNRIPIWPGQPGREHHH
jgi:hypothetical protein